jgi:hypothetical protein
MDKNEFSEWYNQQVQPRWPTWQVNKITLADWFAAFGRFDKNLLTRAVQHHKIHDDPSSPRMKKLFEIIKKLCPPKPQALQNTSEKLYSPTQWWEMVRTTWSKEKRIENMLGFIKWYPKAKEKDPEAYEWIVKDRLNEKLGIKYQPRFLTRYQNTTPLQTQNSRPQT